MEIESLLNHPFFDDIREPKAMEDCRLSLVQVLRGNHSIMAKTSLDICEVEVIGMRIGKEVFELLKTVILLKKGKRYEFMNIISGPQYLKVQAIDDDRYPFLDSAISFTFDTRRSGALS
jgi:hypothetical protein